MANRESYILQDGRAGRDRLRVLARVTAPGTDMLFDRLGIGPGMRCLDVGCGGGDVSATLARRVGASGHVTAVDFDPVTLDIAAREAEESGLSSISFVAADVFLLAESLRAVEPFDVGYARFLLTHLGEPAAALRSIAACVRPGGLVVVEDIDFSGHFSFPDCPALHAYMRFYAELARRVGGDAEIGRRLPLLLREAGLADVSMSISQPAGTQGEEKLISAITMESIAGRVVDEGLATAEQAAQTVRVLHEAAASPDVVMSTPRFVQCWGRRPG